MDYLYNAVDDDDVRGEHGGRGGSGGCGECGGRGGAANAVQRVRTTSAQRQRITEAFKNDEDYVEVACVLGDTITARSIFRVYVTEGRVQSFPTGGATYRKLLMT